jgi:hypothetical protein
VWNEHSKKQTKLTQYTSLTELFIADGLALNDIGRVLGGGLKPARVSAAFRRDNSSGCLIAEPINNILPITSSKNFDFMVRNKGITTVSNLSPRSSLNYENSY